MAVRDVCLCLYSLRKYKDNRGGEDVNKVIKYLFADGNKRKSLVIAFGHITKRVANVQNVIYRPDNPPSIIE